MQTRPKIQIDLVKVENLAGLGLNKEQIANALGMSYATLNRNQKVRQDLQDAINRGKARRIGFVANKLQTLIDEGNLGAIIFYLKTQGGFVETQRQIITDNQDGESGGGLSSIYERMKAANKK